MKIGIITWFRYENYGTILQAIALQKYLRRLGHEVELIDFGILEKENGKNLSCKTPYELFGKIVLKTNKMVFAKQFSERSKKMQKAISRNCNVSKTVKSNSDYIKLCNQYDLIICGSDQIWNPNWYHPYYFVNFEEVLTSRISYAPSFGVDVILNELEQIYKVALNRFRSLAVREDRGREIIKEITGKNAELVVDPTMLLDSKDWEEICSNGKKVRGKYILCYMLSDNKHHWRAIRRFARVKKMKIVVIPQGGHSFLQSRNVVRDCGVEDFLSLIKNAEYVITDSFHGSIFSILFKKELIVFERHDPCSNNSQNSRIYNLLTISGLKGRMIPYSSGNIEIKSSINYNDVVKILSAMIKKSKKYLSENITDE